ncbi:MAG: GntR family transcriptional regulator [Pseudomonadota bacterium]|nr:GntR family transcriptional regulator [Pseudomonadota bacterium]
MPHTFSVDSPELAAVAAPLADGPPKLPFDRLHISDQHSAPLWRQLLNQLTEMVEAGELLPGTSLPPERDLAQSLGVSRVTVKRCYDELRREGMLAGRGRAGSVLQAQVPRVQPALGRLKGFSEEMRELGLTASTRLELRELTSNRSIASIFSRPSSAPFLYLTRVREGDSVPMTRELAWYDLTLAPVLADWDGHGSAYTWLRERAGLTLARAEQTVEAISSSPAEMAAFGYSEPQPCLLFKRRTYTAQGQLAEYVEGTFRGDAYVYRMELSV